MTTTTAGTTTGTTFYTLPVNLPRIIAAFDKVNRRLERTTGVHEPLRVLSREETTLTDPEAGGQLPVVALRVNWVLAAGEWRVAGVVTPVNSHSADYTYRAVDKTVPAPVVTDPRLCEHCGQRRNRVMLFVLADTQGNTMQVGTTCMEPHTGIKATKSLGLLLHRDPLDFLDPSDVVEDPEDWGGHDLPRAWSSEVEFPVRDVLGTAAHMFLTDEDESTAGGVYYSPKERAMDALCGEGLPVVTAKERAVADATYEAFRGSSEEPGTYRGNLAAALANTTVSRKQLGLVISAVGSYLRQQAREKEAAARAASINPAPWAPEGTKLSKAAPLVARLVFTFEYETPWGPVWRYVFHTEAGHEITWKSARGMCFDLSAEEPGCNNYCPTTGDVVTFTSGYVKSVGEYRGHTQTVMTRLRPASVRRGNEAGPAPWGE